MADIYPSKLPKESSAAEQKVHKLLKEGLSQDYCVICNQWVHGINEQHGGARDHEIDFIVAHPKHGMLCLEVKGGKIQISGGQWYSVDGRGGKHRIRNPMRQVQDASYKLRNWLRKQTETQQHDWSAAYAIVLPDVELTEGRDLTPDIPRKLVLDRSDLKKSALQRRVEEIFAHYRLPKFSQKLLKLLKRKLLPDCMLHTPLVKEFESEEDQIKELTEKQFEILRGLVAPEIDKPRYLIRGVAGSGKTMLAVEVARRLAQSGRRVLYVCYNKNLAYWIASHVPPHEHLKISTFHGLCMELSGQGDYNSNMGITQRDFYDALLPNWLAEAAAQRPELRFDAIIVDEGQDFKRTFWNPLLDLLHDRERSRFYVFADESQRIYSRDEIQIEPFPVFLSKNLRNTRPIGEYVGKYHRGNIQYEVAGPETTRQVERVDAESQQLDRKLVEILNRLKRGKVPLSHVIMLTPFRDRSHWYDGQQLGKYTLKWGITSDDPNTLCVTTIQSFKGLERPVVIVSEMNRARHVTDDLDALRYVAYSRARNHLILLGDQG